YIHAEQFVSDVVKAYQRKTFDEFKERYHSLDLLLIDDVQFFANKDRTQEEFFNAFEALLAKKSHIVMTSDTYPKGLADIHERLVSRFDSGLTVAIEPPELEMRVAILINKARAEGTEMPEEVAFLVAKNVRADVRQIAMYLAKELTQKSLPEIGELFGGRDHTTVLHAVRKISGERKQLTELNQQLHVLEQTLKG